MAPQRPYAIALDERPLATHCGHSLASTAMPAHAPLPPLRCSERVIALKGSVGRLR